MIHYRNITFQTHFSYKYIYNQHLSSIKICLKRLNQYFTKTNNVRQQFFAKTKVTSKQATSRVMSVAEAKRHYAKFKELRTSYQEKTGVNLFAKRFAIGTGTVKTKHMQSNE